MDPFFIQCFRLESQSSINVQSPLHKNLLKKFYCPSTIKSYLKRLSRKTDKYPKKYFKKKKQNIASKNSSIITHSPVWTARQADPTIMSFTDKMCNIFF